MNEGFPVIKPIKKPENSLSISETVKKFLRASLISALLTYGSLGEAAGQQVESGTAKEPGENNRGNISSTVSIETPATVSNKENLPVNSEIIKGFVFLDKNEKAFLSKENEDSYFTPNDFKNNGDNGVVPLEEIEKFCEEQKIKDVFLTHTHPISVYSSVGYDDEEIKKMQSGELQPPPMAPSIVDFQGMAQIFRSLEEKEIKINGKVFDATGVWEYRVSDKNTETFKKYKELIEKIPEIGTKITESFSNEEKELFKKYAIGIHQEKIMQILKQNPETHALGEKLEKVAMVELEKISKQYIQTIEGMNGINETGYKISSYTRAGSDYKKTQTLDDLIEKYKTEAAKLGFEIEYTPYQNN
ncbi:MAG: hypothetical protein WC694_02455 [Candidatus Paceibacterota bacterium]|jgi:hypothetical protein